MIKCRPPRAPLRVASSIIRREIQPRLVTREGRRKVRGFFDENATRLASLRQIREEATAGVLDGLGASFVKVGVT